MLRITLCSSHITQKRKKKERWLYTCSIHVRLVRTVIISPRKWHIFIKRIAYVTVYNKLRSNPHTVLSTFIGLYLNMYTGELYVHHVINSTCKPCTYWRLMRNAAPALHYVDCQVHSTLCYRILQICSGLNCRNSLPVPGLHFLVIPLRIDWIKYV
jgi:hypothetical protein